MAIEIIASHMKADAKYGQGGSDTPSSIRPGETIKRSDVAKSIIAADGSVNAAAGDWQTRPVSADQAVATNPGAKGRTSVTDGSPGGRVPDRLDYKKS
jgi:hypothetical protein